ncbi:MAG: YcaO-like family protein [Gordonia sp. (in: high G+C Gram-positive bacteria)]|nr:YcaO-like family protein [Gordonia sp. (in: high G+C Gram-positive bacteria)]
MTIQDTESPSTVLPVDALVDAECGLIRSVRDVPHPQGAPSSYVGVTASVSDARLLGEWPADRVSLGTSFGDHATARIAAIAEGVERYCGNWLPASLGRDFVVGSRSDLARSGQASIDLSDLPRFADWQYQRAGFPYVPLLDDTPTLWTRSAELHGDHVWMPASLMHLNWRQSRFRHLPRTHHLNYAGIATGQGAEDARDRGILEVIERDALETWWHLAGPTVGIRTDSVPGLAADIGGSSLRVHLVLMPSEFAPAIAALVYDSSRDIYAAGFSAALDPVRAARKAVLEAVHTWVYTQGCTSEEGWVFRAVSKGLMAKGLQLPFRRDGRYLDEAGPQYSKVVDLGAHVQVWLDPRVHVEARRFTEPALGEVSIDDIEAVAIDDVYDRLQAGGHRVITRDMTTSDVRRTSLRVVRTFVTGLVPNAPAAFGYFGMPRFAEVAQDRAWRDSFDGRPGEFTLVPPPHM